jgi:hypothetical protein
MTERDDLTRAQRSKAPQPTDVPEQDKLTPSCGSCWAFGAERHAVRQSIFGQPWLKSMAPVNDDGEELNVIDFADDDDEDEIMMAEEEVEIWVVSDSGAVKHMANPKHIPGTVRVVRPAKARRFVTANNQPIEDYGEAQVDLEMEGGAEISNVFQVADVSRPLHSTSTICDANHEMLYTKHEAVVVPEGALSKFLASVNVVAKYQRRGGLYMAKMKAKDPRLRRKSGFARPGARR